MTIFLKKIFFDHIFFYDFVCNESRSEIIIDDEHKLVTHVHIHYYGAKEPIRKEYKAREVNWRAFDWFKFIQI